MTSCISTNTNHLIKSYVYLDFDFHNLVKLTFLVIDKWYLSKHRFPQREHYCSSLQEERGPEWESYRFASSFHISTPPMEEEFSTIDTKWLANWQNEKEILSSQFILFFLKKKKPPPLPHHMPPSLYNGLSLVRVYAFALYCALCFRITVFPNYHWIHNYAT